MAARDRGVRSCAVRLCLRAQDDAADDSIGKATVDDPRASEQWALDSIGAYDAWAQAKSQDEETGAPKVIVALLDNGCLIDHEDLQGNIVDTYNAAVAGQAEEDRADAENADDAGSGDGEEAGLDSAATDASATDGADAAALKDVTPFIDNHGTHVAGIVAARANNGKGVACVSYNAGILPVQVFRKTKSGGNTARVSDIAFAYDYLMAYNADEAHEAKVKVANFSLGVTKQPSEEIDEEDELLVQKVAQAHDAGILTVLSSGNGGSSGAYLNFPSDWLSDELSVISLKEGSSGQAPSRVSSSNYNMEGQTTKDIAAPGAVTYAKLASGSSPRLTVNKKTGAITVKRNTPAGTYRIRVRVKAAATADYKAKSQVVTVRIRVKE